MALIGTIRNNFWFVLIVLGLALLAFLFMDIFGGAAGGGAATGPTLGNVAGEDIGYNEFRTAEATLYKGSTANTYAVQNSLWNFFVEKVLVNKEAEALGLDVSKEELRDLEFGNTPHPMIANYFRNPQTGQLDRAQLNSVRDAIDNGEVENPEFERYWLEQRKQIVKDQKQSKLNAMVSKAIFTPSWMIKESSALSTSTASFDYVKVPFDYIPDAEIEVTDSDISSFLNKNKVRYTNAKETRRAEYFVFNVLPTAADSAANKETILADIAEFKKSPPDQDSIFAINRNGSYSNYFASASEIPENVREAVQNLEIGNIHGPYIENGYYSAIKLIDRKVVPDSAKVRHILKAANPMDPNSMTAARTLIDSIYTEIKARRANFKDMVEQFSDDQGSKANGGEYDYAPQGTYVPEFNEVCFFANEGDYKIVNTQFGVHLINVIDQKFNNRDPKYKTSTIRVPIIPSQDTQDAMYSEVTDLVSTSTDGASLKQAASARGVEGELTVYMDDTFYAIGSLGADKSSKDIIKWMFDTDTDINEISKDIYTYSDPQLYHNNKYVAVMLKDIAPKGLRSVASVKDELEVLVRNEMKGEKIKSQITGSDLSSISQQFGQDISSIVSANYSSNNIPQLGSEPKVLAYVMNNGLNEVSSPIVGNSGVYVVKTVDKNDGVASANIPTLRNSANTTDRSRVQTGLINALKKKADISDSRIALDF